MRQGFAPKISLSVSDIPLGVSMEEHFSLARDIGVDGVEVVAGYKAGITLRKLEKLSSKYSLQILSVHQSPWSFVGLFHDKRGFRIAKYFGAKYVAHPSFVRSLHCEKTNYFLDWLFEMGEKYNLEILLENMSKVATYSSFRRFLKRDETLSDLFFLKKICEKYNFGLTLDTSHLNSPFPHLIEGFNQIHPFIKNIHLSDFNDSFQHMSLGQGNFKIYDFLDYLKLSNYSNFITLELPVKFFYSKNKYVEDIHNSISFVKNQFYN